jgi:hypothetical protein
MGFQPSGVKEFVKLDDTPAAFTGQGTKSVKVNAGETALEFQPEGGITGVTVRKNSQMPVVGSRPQLNLLEGAATDLKIADNPPDNEIDITIGAKYPTRYFTLIPDDAILPTANPPALATVDGTNFSYNVLDYDPAIEEKAYWGYWLTPDYQDENIVMDIYWISSGAGNVKWGVQVLGRADGEAYDAALGSEKVVITPTGGAGVLNKSRIPTFAPNWAGQDVVHVKVARKAADAADTLDADARVVKVVTSYTGEFAQAFYPLTAPVKMSVDLATWTDVDVSEYVPTGATGVILHLNNRASVPARDYAFRKKGSTDDLSDKEIAPTSHLWAMVGIDENRVFQAYLQDNNQMDVWLVGFTATGVVFFDNAYLKSIGGNDAWLDVDLSAELPGDAIGVIIDCVNTNLTINSGYGFRKDGSTTAKVFPGTPGKGHSFVIVGCSGAQVIEAYTSVEFANLQIRIVGYVTQGAVFPTNPTEYTLSGAGAWEDLDASAQAPSALMLFFHIFSSAASRDYGLRKNGSGEEICPDVGQLAYGFIPCDSGQVVEAQVSDLGVTFLLDGYAQWAGA